MDLYIYKNGHNVGPLSPAQARLGISEGQYQLSDQAITRSTNSWTTLEEVLRLLESPTPSAPSNFTESDFDSSTSPSIVPVNPVATPSSQPVSPPPPSPQPSSPSPSTPSIPQAPAPKTSPAPALPANINSAGESVFQSKGCIMAGIYAVALSVVVMPIAKGIESLARQNSSFGIFYGPLTVLSLVAVVAWVVGLIQPQLFDRVVGRVATLKTSFLSKGVTRSHVSYIFGTLLFLSAAFASSTNTGLFQKEKQELIAKKQEEQRQAEATRLASIQAEKEAKAKEDRETKEREKKEQENRLRQKRREAEDELRQKRLDAEARSAEVQARIDERAENARAQVAAEQAAEQAKAEEFEPKIESNDFGLTIFNNSETDWKDCTVFINNGLLDSGYHTKVRLIAAGDSVFVPYSEFANNEGERFSIYELKIKGVRLHAYINGKLIGKELNPNSS